MPAGSLDAANLAVRRVEGYKPSTGNRLMVHNVPHVLQSPFNTWSDPRLNDGCEEASLLMAMSWIRGEPYSSAQVQQEIINMSELEKRMWGFFQDTSAADTASLMKAYFGYPINVQHNISTSDIVVALSQNKAVIVPINGSKFYANGGPPRHTIVIKGFDFETVEFIVNDPYLINGGDLRVEEQVLSQSLKDYYSGVHIGRRPAHNAMLTIDWPWVTP
ncbi:MAG TPA: C39 family peptidase [Coxiellaceae bacterium]|nr:C39 family peptidase [Coxiellaceae bacterium]